MADENEIILTEDGQEAYDAAKAENEELTVEEWSAGLDEEEQEVYIGTAETDESETDADTNTGTEDNPDAPEGDSTGDAPEGDANADATEGDADQGAGASDTAEAGDAPEEEESEDSDVEEADPTEGMSPAVLRVHKALTSYQDQMASNQRQTPDSGRQPQRALYRTIMDILSLEGEDFRDAMSLLLSMFNEDVKGAFSKRNVFRFMDVAMQSKDETKAFQAILTFLVAVAEPQGRELALQQVDIQKVAERIPDTERQAKFLGYFGEG